MVPAEALPGLLRQGEAQVAGSVQRQGGQLVDIYLNMYIYIYIMMGVSMMDIHPDGYISYGSYRETLVYTCKYTYIHMYVD